MRIVFCWVGISGYMATCWTELAKRAGIDLLVLGYRSEAVVNNFEAGDIMRGLNCRLLDHDERQDYGLIHRSVKDFRPDIMFLPGWCSNTYMRLAFERDLAHIPRIMTLDSPRNSSDIRQVFARLKIGRYLDQQAGRPSFRFATFISLSRISTGKTRKYVNNR
jgi:hypothetical protein